MQYQFFALPEEQRKWLTEIVSLDSVWCRAWVRGAGDFDISERADLERFPFEDPAAGQAHIGSIALSLPVWQLGPKGRRLDTIRSQAVQFLPTTLAGNHILLEGRIGILSPSYYLEKGLDPKPVQAWYRRIKRSLQKTMSADFMLTVHAQNGHIVEWPSMGISSGAVEWHENGKLLKQFEKGPLIYHVRRRSSKNRAARKSRS